ncbi:hypothetical protein J2W49_001237 [Hydrogenophaga palleronii]|uniref:Uncharacterized protein n=1 Tax=Hydrogenophaga palleronii TaxID=65655 RepID=A0ABU1WJ62_9BURK|nr:hypothetical protein [Hydrogenophaga palleronii]MDR7149288.1 hypothetical protein [Hydrogenophaga palleronii]
METPSLLLTRRMALGALTGAALLSALPAQALGSLANVRVIDRDRNRVLPLYPHRGELWLPGEPGARYAVELFNESGERLLAVVSVDGVNVITGETAAFHQSGYALAPGQRYEVTGWRKSHREVAVFRFTDLPRSYAARTGRPDDVGVIGVAVFREKAARPTPRPPWGHYGDVPQAQGRSAPEAQGKSIPWGTGPQLGTGHGERERDRVSSTDFVRRSQRPDEITLIRYDSHANLVARGIAPPPRRRPRFDHHPNPFPGARPGFAPDPY